MLLLFFAERAPQLMMCELYPLVDVPPTSRCVRIYTCIDTCPHPPSLGAGWPCPWLEPAFHADVVLQFHHRGEGLRDVLVEQSDDALGLTRLRWAIIRLHALGRTSEIAGRHNHRDDDDVAESSGTNRNEAECSLTFYIDTEVTTPNHPRGPGTGRNSWASR